MQLGCLIQGVWDCGKLEMNSRYFRKICKKENYVMELWTGLNWLKVRAQDELE